MAVNLIMLCYDISVVSCWGFIGLSFEGTELICKSNFVVGVHSSTIDSLSLLSQIAIIVYGLTYLCTSVFQSPKSCAKCIVEYVPVDMWEYPKIDSLWNHMEINPVYWSPILMSQK